jgi:hypothetical protein
MKMNNRGQFSIIAALLVAIILAGTLIAVYSTIRYGSSQSQSPQTLIATDETNSAFQKALGFTVGYYGSILQVTGNQTYAYANATIYMNSALQYIASMNPSWGESIKMTSLNLSTNWFSNPSISTGKLSVVYDLQNLGIYGINYTTSCSLGLQIFNSPNSNQVCLNVTQDLTEPLTSLGQQNFAFYFYNYSISDWQLVNPSLTPTIFTNGTYLINIPSEIDDSAYMVQVTDSRGIMVEASSFNSYNINFTFGSQSTMQNTPVIVELLQNGTMRWFGQDILNATQTRSIPPIPIKSLHLCQTGSTSDLPFQVEDWASQYQIPLGMSSNYTIFSNNQMIVFEVSPSMSQLTLWWNGSDTAIQPSTAYTNTYFTADNPAAGTLTNGNITLQFSYPNSAFQIKSIVGNVSSTANFMRIDADPSTYGSGLAYIIQHGVVRDIVQEEAEWSNGATNCPNVYSQIVFTLPANATYFTYQLRLISINSTAARNINDISPIQLATSISQPQAMTENGITNGIPNVTNGTGTFNNSTGNAHHWSQLINNVTLQGTGIMFSDSANQQLYAFDSMAGAGKFTGALYVNTSVPVIELDPVTSAGNVSFTSALDLTWYGAVVTFSGANPIYANNGNSGLWSLVEQPPSVAITSVSSSAAWINVSPSADPVGTSVTVSGGGFIPNSPITITYNGNTVATTTATAYGMIPSGTSFVIPSSPLGSYTIRAIDASSNSASANFTVTLYPMETVTFQPSGISSDAGTATILTIDSVQYTYSTLPISFTWEAGSTHTITASSTLAAGTGKQYVWASWSDGGAQTHNYTVPTSSATITANWQTQYQVTFSQTGVDSSAGSNTVLTVGSTNYAYNALPSSVWVDSGTTFTWASTVSGGSGKQFVKTGSSGTSPISAAGTYSATYKTQWQVTFQQSGLSSDASGTVLTVGANTYSYGQLPQTGVWVDDGTAFSYASTVAVSGGTKQYVWTSNTGGLTSPVRASGTVTGNYKTQWLQTFSGLGGDATGNLVSFSVSGGSYSGATSPIGVSGGSIWVDNGATVTYTFVNTVTSSVTGKQYRFISNTGPASPITVSAANTLTATYLAQYQVTFSQTGVDSSAGSNTVLTVGSTNYAYNALPSSVWVDSGTTFTWASTVSGGSGKQFVKTGSSGTSPISAAGTYSATYKTQYYQTVTSSPATGSGYITVDGAAQAAPYQAWWDSGSSHTIAANSPVTLVSGQSQYIYSSWSDSGAQSHSVSPTAVTTYTASFQLQYYFSVSSARDTATGQGWYNAGSSASSTVTRPVSGGTGIQYETTGWTGTGSLSSGGSAGSSSTGSFTINAYSTCTWNWKTQYQLTVTSAAGTPSGQSSGYYDAGTSITSSVSATIHITGPPIIDYTSTGYTGTGSAGSGSSQTVTFTLNGASTVTWNWHGLMTLYPNGYAGSGPPNSEGIASATSGSTNHWKDVSDYTLADATAFVYTSSSGTFTDYYLTQDHGSASGSINSVSVNIRAMQTGSSGSARTYLRLGTNAASGTSRTLTTSYATYSDTFTRPGGGSWTWTDIDNLQSGVSLIRSGYSTTMRCTLVWVVIDFNA